MIVNLLDVSKADEGQLEPKPVRIPLAAFVDDIVASMQVRAQSSSVTLERAVAADAHVDGDPDLLRRVIENLIDNAIRHAPEDSRVSLAASRADDGTEIRVRDAGAGVPPEQRDQVFDRFVTAHGTRSNRGLGLSFCKLAVEAHRGRIWIEDATPGAVFCIWMPDAAQ
jgi:two-component system, sensor histidine kinase and response regulator